MKKNNESEKAFLKTKEYVWGQNNEEKLVDPPIHYITSVNAL